MRCRGGVKVKLWVATWDRSLELCVFSLRDAGSCSITLPLCTGQCSLLLAVGRKQAFRGQQGRTYLRKQGLGEEAVVSAKGLE